MASVLLIATRYDLSTAYTFRWAQDLQQGLLDLQHQVLLLDGATALHQGNLLIDAIQEADYLVFYGHGDDNSMTARPDRAGGAGFPLIDLISVGMLQNCHVYAGCCRSLKGLGQAYDLLPFHQSYIGYNDEFGFDLGIHQHFRDIVNLSVTRFVSGDSAQTVVNYLRASWQGLSDDLHHGPLRHFPNAPQTSFTAADNAGRIGFVA